MKEMRDYIITVNSTVDMPKEWLKERGVPVIPLKYTMDGQTYTDMEDLTAKEFFNKLREGKMSVTSQVNPEEAKGNAGAICKRRKGCAASEFFIWIKRNCQQYEDGCRGTE